jgi:hypothetical protein
MIEYAAQDVRYWQGKYGVTVSLPTGSDYTLEVGAPGDSLVARVFRVMVDGLDKTRRNALFRDQPLARGGAMKISLQAAGSPENQPFSIDADGDGIFEGSLAPDATLTGTVGYPAIPTPTPATVLAHAALSSSVAVELAFPDVGADGWTWTLTETVPWLVASASAGAAPGTVVLDLTGDSVPGVRTAEMLVTLRFEGYTMDLPVSVILRSGEGVLTTDNDADGIDDTIEDAAPNDGDGNGDGIPDSTQANVGSLPSATAGGFVTLLTDDPDCDLRNLAAVAPGVYPADSDGSGGYLQMRGLLSFEIGCSAASVTLFYHGISELPDAAYRQYGPTPANTNPHWYTLAAANFASVMVGGSPTATASFDLFDGQMGDHDLAVNGVMVALGGVASPSSVSIPTLSSVGLGLTAFLLGLVGLYFVRRRDPSPSPPRGRPS